MDRFYRYFSKTREMLNGLGLILGIVLPVAVGTVTHSALAKAEAGLGAVTLNVPTDVYTLSNGLTVILNRDERLPSVAVEVRYLVGSGHEPSGKTGFAHLFEHLMFQGSKHAPGEYFAPLQPIGARINGTTSQDRTNYYEQVPAQYLEMVLWMESDRMAHLLPALDQQKLDNQRDVVKNERRMRYENRPYGTFYQKVYESLFPKGHPYHHSPIGSHEDLTGASMDDVVAFFNQYYVASNAVLTVSGSFEPEQTKAWIDAYFGNVRSGTRAPVPNFGKTVPGGLKTASKEALVVEDRVQLPKLSWIWPTPALYKEGDAAMDVLASVLGEGKSSRLYKELVYEKQLAKSVEVYQASGYGSSFFVVSATAAVGVEPQVLSEAVESALQGAWSTPVTAKEVQRAVNGWEKSFYDRLLSPLSRATALSTYYHFTGEADYFNADLNRYARLRPVDIEQARQTWLKSEYAHRIWYVPQKKQAQASLR